MGLRKLSVCIVQRLTCRKVYNMFHRQYMHKMLMDSALNEHGEGIPAKLVVKHKLRRHSVKGLEVLISAGRDC